MPKSSQPTASSPSWRIVCLNNAFHVSAGIGILLFRVTTFFRTTIIVNFINNHPKRSVLCNEEQNVEKDHYKTSVIIATKNRPQELLKCLDSVLKAIRDCDEIIIVENGSNNLLHMKWKDKRIRYFHLSNPNRVEARNFGIRVAQGEIVAFIDDDSTVSPHWLQNLLDAYRQYPQVGSVGGKLLGKLELRSLGPPGGKITPWGSVTHNLQTGEDIVETDVLCGGNISFKRNILLEIGGFDTTYDARTSAYREENDPQTRIKHLGYKLLYQPKAVVYHLQLNIHKSIERGREIVTAEEHAKPRMKNHTYFYLKNYLLQNPLLIMLIPLFLLDMFLMLLIRYKNPLAFYHGFSGFLEAVAGFKERIKRARSQQRLFASLFVNTKSE